MAIVKSKDNRRWPEKYTITLSGCLQVCMWHSPDAKLVDVLVFLDFNLHEPNLFPQNKYSMELDASDRRIRGTDTDQGYFEYVQRLCREEYDADPTVWVAGGDKSCSKVALSRSNFGGLHVACIRHHQNLQSQPSLSLCNCGSWSGMLALTTSTPPPPNDGAPREQNGPLAADNGRNVSS